MAVRIVATHYSVTALRNDKPVATAVRNLWGWHVPLPAVEPWTVDNLGLRHRNPRPGPRWASVATREAAAGALLRLALGAVS